MRLNHFYSGKKILVTGGIGFVGSNLVHRLVDLGASVTVVDALLPAYGARLKSIAEVRDRIDLHTIDLRDSKSMLPIVKDQDIIFSLAGQISHIDSMRDPMTDLEINLRSHVSLLECCRANNPVAKIVFSSTRQVYGRPNYLPVDERHPLCPIDVNGIHKLAAESYYTLYNQIYGIPSTSLRLTNTYGPRMDLVSDVKGFIGVFVRRALNGESIKLFGTGTQRRDFNYIDDVSEALLLAGSHAETNGKIYNLGYPQPYSLTDFATMLRSHADFKLEVVPFPEDRKQIDIGDYYGSFAAFSAATGWKPRTDIEAGIAATMNFFSLNRDYLTSPTP